jgi:hypothetical protein
MATTGANYEIGAFSASATFTPAASSHTAGACNGAAGTFTLSPVPPTGALSRLPTLRWKSTGRPSRQRHGRCISITSRRRPRLPMMRHSICHPVTGQPISARLRFRRSLTSAPRFGSRRTASTRPQVLLGNTIFGYLVNGTTLTPQAVAHIVKIYGTVGPQ